MVLSVYVDAWWHEAIGRESFWIPPHIGIYTGLVISLVGLFSLLRDTWGRVHRGLWMAAFGLASIITAGYADELWHERFGVEKVGTLAALWSSTHIAALVGGIVTSLGILYYLSSMMRTVSGRDDRVGWFLAAEFGVLVSVTTLLLLPLGPETPFRVLGVLGASVVAFVILSLRFAGSVLSEKPWALTLITSFNWTGNAILLTNHASPVLTLLLLAVGVSPPFIGDLLLQRGRRKGALKTAYLEVGLIWGAVFGALFYPLTNGLLAPALDPISVFLAGGSSALASVVAGRLAGLLSERRLAERALLMGLIKLGTEVRL